jgi:MSHA biogenesis protein MshM
MYLERFQLKELPFGLAPDRRFFFAGGAHGETLENLRWALRNGERVIKVVGEAGSGKTLLCQELMTTLDEGWTLTYLSHPLPTSREMLLVLAAQLRARSADSQTGERERPTPSTDEEIPNDRLLDWVTERLIALREAGQTVVLLIDRAHALSLTCLDAIQRLATSETQSGPLLQVVLFGRAELDALLSGRSFKALSQRLLSSYRLRGMDRFDLEAYLEHRLAVAGSLQTDLFTRGALNALWKGSRGLPNQLNILCHESMLAAAAAGAAVIRRDHVRLALAQLGTSPWLVSHAAPTLDPTPPVAAEARPAPPSRKPGQPSLYWSMLTGVSVAIVAALLLVPRVPFGVSRTPRVDDALTPNAAQEAPASAGAIEASATNTDDVAAASSVASAIPLPPVSAISLGRKRGPAELHGIRVNGPEAHTRLTIELSRLTGHSVEHDPKRGDLHILLSDTLVVEPPAPVNLRGTAIRAIKSDYFNKDLRLHLHLGNAVWTHVAMLTDPKPPRLVVDLSAAPGTALPPAAPRKAAPVAAARPRPLPSSFSKKSVSVSDPQRAEKLYQRGVRLAEKGQLAEAFGALQEAVLLDSTHLGAREALASGVIQFGRPQEAIYLLDEGLQIEPGYPPFVKLKARILLQRGALGEALELLTQATPPVDADPDYHALIAALYLRRGEHRLAVERYWEILKTEADRGAWWLGLAIALEADGAPTQALMAYRTAHAVGGLGLDSRLYVEARIGALEPKGR